MLSSFPVTPSFAAEIGDIDLSLPLDTDDLKAAGAAFATYVVLVFPAQKLSADQHLNLGPIERTVDSMLTGKKLRVAEGSSDIANLDADGNLWQKDNAMRQCQMMGNRLWHTDSSFKAPSGYASILYGRSLPPIGGNTEYADLRAAWDVSSAATTAREGPGRRAFAPVLEKAYRIHEVHRCRTEGFRASIASACANYPGVFPRILIHCLSYRTDPGSNGRRDRSSAQWIDRPRYPAAVRLCSSLARR
jgi:hypothetical protein